ncbi:MAG: zinc metallopeptidase [Oscillospiraceae bacterium]|nr:zinc metallopeptidase [Oscillospiraceae bacterium]
MNSLLYITFGPGYGGFNGYYLYVILVIPALILSLVAQFKVKRAYSSLSEIYSKSGYSGASAAGAVLRYYGITDVRIEQVSGTLTDHYSPSSKVIRLSEGVYSSTSIAAIGIACHEAGHAAQHANGYVPIKIRNAILPVCKIGSYAGIPLAVLGLVLSFEPLVGIGLLLYSFIMLFQLATLPVELDASRRALQVIEETGLLSSNDEYKGAKKVLTCAAMTYVAALAVSLANLLRFIIMFTGRRRK